MLKRRTREMERDRKGDGEMYLDHAWIGDDSLEFDCIDQGFTEGNVFDTGVVESVDVIPDCV
jgi:hypothetical protein